MYICNWKVLFYSMSVNFPSPMESKVIRITITLNRNVYEHIKRISSNMGLRPSTWMTMVCTAKANNVDIAFDDTVVEK